MKFSHRILCVCAAFVCSVCSVFAIPGIKEYLPNESGQYVYYRDYSFAAETYIGFLFYDDYTFAMRYVSPNAETGSKNIELLVSFNKEKDAVELSGEKLVTTVTADDVDVLNYMHDLLYEFSARRKKINDRDLRSTVRTTANFTQFGGEVVMYYDFFVPIFNLRNITGVGGEKLFELVRMGVLTDSTDTTFDIFAGVPSLSEKAESYDFALNKSAKQMPATSDLISLNLDNQWQKAMDNMWMLGENSVAVAVLDSIQMDTASFKSAGIAPEDYLIRLFLLTNADSVPSLPSLTMKRTDNSVRIDTVSYVSETAAQIHDTKYLLKVSDGQYGFLALTVFNSVYAENKPYFENILSSAKSRIK